MYYWREMSRAELCIPILLFLVGRQRENINLPKKYSILHCIEDSYSFPFGMKYLLF